jgi:hypothetical protein
MFMSSSCAGIHSRKRRVAFLRRGAKSINSLKGLFVYLLEEHLAAVAALWMVCFPLMYFALYGDLVQSARTLVGMTVTFVAFLMISITAMLSVSFLVFCSFELRKRRRFGTSSARGRLW